MFRDPCVELKPLPTDPCWKFCSGFTNQQGVSFPPTLALICYENFPSDPVQVAEVWLYRNPGSDGFFVFEYRAMTLDFRYGVFPTSAEVLSWLLDAGQVSHHDRVPLLASLPFDDLRQAGWLI